MATNKTKVQIVRTVYDPIVMILADFYTTAVINIITCNKAYAIFPLQTYVRYKTYLTKGISNWYGKQLSKYSLRGWESRDVLWPEECPTNCGLRDFRRVGDKWTWVIPLDMTNILPARTPDFVLEHSEFTVTTAEQGGGGRNTSFDRYDISCKANFRSYVLRYRYIHSNPRNFQPNPVYYGNFWFNFVGPRVERLTEIELVKMKEEKQPEWYRRDAPTRFSHYDRPIPDKSPTWTS